MLKSFVVLAITGAISAPAAAQPTPAAPATDQSQPAKPQTVKKRVCETIDEDPYSRLGNRKICKTIEVPAPASAGGGSPNAPVPASGQAPASDK